MDIFGASVLDGSIKLAFGISSDIPKVHEEGLVAVEEELWGGGVLTEVVF